MGSPASNQAAGLRKGAWSPEEDALLRKCIDKYGIGKWSFVPGRAGLNRCRKSCRLRWLNYLNPNIRRGSFSEEEDDLIIRLHKLLGNRWSLIAGRIPGRTANDIKNYWNCHLSKKIESDHKSACSSFEVIKPQPQTIPMNWVWSKDQINCEIKHQELITAVSTTPFDLEKQAIFASNETVKKGLSQAMSPTGFTMTEIETNPRMNDILGLGDEEMFWGDIGGWEDLDFAIDG